MTDKSIPPEGYSEEERYFHEKELELLQRQKLKVQSRQAKQAHWMKCPKCGGDLVETNMEGVMVDRCPGCEGIFLDRGELEQLSCSHDSGFFASLRKMF